MDWWCQMEEMKLLWNLSEAKHSHYLLIQKYQHPMHWSNLSRKWDKDIQEGPYVLLYPDCSEVIRVPGSEKPFKLAEYKKELGKPYSRITFYICFEKHILKEVSKSHLSHLIFYIFEILFCRINIQCLYNLLNVLFSQQWMTLQTQILKLSLRQGAQLNSMELTLWYIIYLIMF